MPGRWLLAAVAVVLGLLPPAATAANLTWTGAGGDANWSTGANWGGVAPVNGDDLFFGAPFQTANFDDIPFLGVGGVTFNPGAPAFTLTINGQLLTISILGIVNNSGVGQVWGVGGGVTPGTAGSLQLVNNTVITTGAGVTIGNNPAAVAGALFGYTVFANNANAGSATLNNFGGNAFSDGGMAVFLNAATASTATFNNDPAGVAMAAGGSVHFYDNATAGNALINNNGAAVLGAGTGLTEFHGSATAGNATINNGSATLAGAGSAHTEFNDTSTAAGANLFNVGGTVNGGSGGYTRFWDTATAGTATIQNNGGTVNGAGGGYTLFMGTSGAGSATLNNNAGTVANAMGGSTEFRNTSSAQGATIHNAAAAVADAEGGNVAFWDTATAGNATFNNYAAGLFGAGGGEVHFHSFSTAGSATFNNFGSTWGGAGGGLAEFHDNSTAGSAVFHNRGTTSWSGNAGITRFNDTAAAGNATFNNYGVGAGELLAGRTLFFNNSTAGSAVFNNTSGISNGGGGFTTFADNSTAANGVFHNQGSTVAATGGGSISFYNNSTAANAVVNNNAGTIAGGGGGGASFWGNSTAGNATINNAGSAVAGAFAGVTWFVEDTSGGNATLIAQGSSAAGGMGGRTVFDETSSAGNATLIAQGGSGGGPGGQTIFSDRSVGGTARVIANDNGQLDISTLAPITPSLTVGSIEGSGQFFLGNKNLTVGGNNLDTVVSGVIQDGGLAPGVGGSLTKVGAGTLTLSGPNTHTGGTVINGGTVNVLHSQGLGLGNVTLTSGLLKSDPLVINIAGNYVQGAGATWQAAIAGTAPGQFDRLNITGTATLGGTLRAVSFGGFMARVGDSVTLVHSAGGLGGTTLATLDDQVVTSGAAVQSHLTYGANDVVLEWIQGSFLPFALTHNQRSVAFNLDTVVRDPRETVLINYLDTLSAAQLADAYDKIAPEELTSIFQLGFAGAEVQAYNLYNRIRDIRAGSSGFSTSGLSLYDPVGAMEGLPRFASNLCRDKEVAMSRKALEPAPDNRWGVFVSGAGELAGVRADANASGYHLTSGGLTVGADYRCNENFAVGVALGYNNTTADLTGDGKVDVNGGRGDLYGVWFKDGWHVEAMAGGGFNTYDTKREALLGDAKGDTQGREIEGLLGFGYDWQNGPWTFGPLAKAQYTNVDIDSFREDGSMAPLRINSQDADSLYSQVGAHLMYRAKCGKVVLVPEIEVGWRHEYLESAVSLDSSFASGAGMVFDVRGPVLGRDSLVAGAGLTVQWNNRVGTSFNYDAQLLRSHYNLHTFSAGIRISL